MGSIKKKRVIVLLILVVASMLPFFLESKFNITGFSTSYDESLDLSYNSNSVFLWEPQTNTQINHVALTGNASGTGDFKVYLIDNEPHLILSFSLINQTVIFEDYSLQDSIKLDSIEKYFIRIEVGNGELNLNKIYYSDSLKNNGSYEVLNSGNSSQNVVNDEIISETLQESVIKESPIIKTSSLNTSVDISDLEFEPYTPNQYEDTLVLGKYEDDGSLNGTIDIEYYVNGTNVFNDTLIVESGSYFNFTLEKGNYSFGDNLSIIITANDSENTSQKQLESIIGFKGPVINSISTTYQTLGLGITNNFTINTTDGNNTIDEVWGYVVNRKNNISLSFSTSGSLWTSSYKSYVLGNHTLDVYVNDSNGIIEHEFITYEVDADILLNIETEQTNYTSNNEEVRIKQLN